MDIAATGLDTANTESLGSRVIEFPIQGLSEAGRAFVAYPDGDGPHPAVLVLHEIFGLNDDMERVARRFASEGYVAMAPDFFGPGFKLGCIIQALRQLNKAEGKVFERLAWAQAWLTAQDAVDQDRIGAVGFCMGGGFALLHAARSEVHVVANYYGEVPKTAEKLEGVPACFGGFGAKDKVFGPKAKILKGHLDELEVDNEIVSYADSGHSYMNDVPGLMATIGAKGPMKVRYDPTSAEDSWIRMLAFFETHLTGELILDEPAAFVEPAIDLTSQRRLVAPDPLGTSDRIHIADTPTA